MKILGILNVTRQFSDGGAYLEPGAAIAHARAMAESGADIIDIGAASSHPDARPVAPEIEIARLAAAVPALKARPVAVHRQLRPDVQRWALEQA